MKNIYVGNLPWEATDEGLKAHFETCGEVSKATIIRDQETNRSRGFGFVEMPNDEEAEKAIQTLDGQELDGRALRVNEARPKEEN